MPFHLYQAWNEGQEPHWFGIRIEYDEDRWVSSCREVDSEGRERSAGVEVAPKFYGVTAEQANRRMVDALENTYDEVVPSARGGASR